MSKLENSQLNKEIHIAKLSQAAAYLLLAHEEHDITNFPIDPSSMSFQASELNMRYCKALYSNPAKPQKLSKEYSYNLILFSWFFLGFAMVKIVTSILLYSYGKTSRESLTYSIVFIVLLGIALGIIIFLIKSTEMCRMVSFTLLTGLGICITSYLIIGDERVFSGITAGEYSQSFINHLIPLIAFIVRLKHVMFNYFKHLIPIVMVSLVLQLGVFLAYSPQDSVITIGEFFIVLLFVALELLDSYQVDYRTKQLFFRKFMDNSSAVQFSQEKTPRPVYSNTSSDIENVMKMCDDIKISISSACKAIIYPGTKKSILDALENFETLKKSIAQLNVKTELKVEIQEDIDDDDKEFIYQNYTNLTPSVQNSNLKKQICIADWVVKPNIFPFKDYGLEELESLLGTVGRNWNFDIWFVYESTGHSVFIIGKYLLQTWNLNDMLNIPTLLSDNFLKKVEKGYKNNPYHNACHAADVLHSMLFYILHSDIITHMSELDSLSFIIAALAHDIQHGAVTNRYLVNSRDPLAIKYNDNSVLENMHASQTFKILSEESANIFSNLSTSDYFTARKLIVDMIIGTDMTKHFSLLGNFRNRAVNLTAIDLDKEEDKTNILVMALKCADLGHSAKGIDLHRKWSGMVCEEFFQQGELEKSKNLPVSMYCDRETTNVPKSQAGFLKNVCLPLFEVWAVYLNSEAVNTHCLTNLRRNLEYWEKKSILRPNTMLYTPEILVTSLIKRKTQDIPRNKSLSTY